MTWSDDQRRGPHQNEHDRREHQDGACDPLDPNETADELEAPHERHLPACVLHRMGDFVRRDRDRRDRASVVVLRQQPHRVRLGIVVIPRIGFLHRDGLQLRFVEQVARKLGAGAREIGPLRAMLAQHALDPELRAEDECQQQQAPEREKDRHAAP